MITAGLDAFGDASLWSMSTADVGSLVVAIERIARRISVAQVSALAQADRSRIADQTGASSTAVWLHNVACATKAAPSPAATAHQCGATHTTSTTGQTADRPHCATSPCYVCTTTSACTATAGPSKSSTADPGSSHQPGSTPNNDPDYTVATAFANSTPRPGRPSVVRLQAVPRPVGYRQTSRYLRALRRVDQHIADCPLHIGAQRGTKGGVVR
jgi:hypothetical protein